MQVACTSMRSSEVNIFDIGYMSSKPVEVSFLFKFSARILTWPSLHGYENCELKIAG